MPETVIVKSLWRYRCPECGVGDEELGHHATADLIWCEVCLEDNRHVRLRRWPVEESGPLPGGG
jgi:late competence protein required for DNA uptake (superfamily II DNA/RNA helicase)